MIFCIRLCDYPPPLSSFLPSDWGAGLGVIYRFSVLFQWRYGQRYTTFLQRCMECRRGMAMRILSVCPSVKRVNCDKTEEKSVQIFIPYERSFSIVFWEEWLVKGDPFYLKFWVNPPLSQIMNDVMNDNIWRLLPISALVWVRSFIEPDF